MANSPLTIDMITNELLRLAHEKASFLGTINRQFDKSFNQSDAKIGDTLRIRLPAQYVRRKGSRVMDVQDAQEQQVSLVTATQDGVDMRWNSREQKLDLTNFSKQHLEPAMAVLISGVESDVLQGVTKDVYQVAGTAGTPPTDLVAIGAARAKINQQLAPKDNNRFIQMDSVTMGGMVNGLKGLFHDDKQVSEQYREGMMGRTGGSDYYENERIWTMANSGDVSGITLDTYTIIDGDSDLSITGAGSAPAVGMVFTIAGMYDLHPETKAAYSHLKQFTVTSATAPTTAAITISPTIYLTGARKNVGDSVGDDVSVSTTAAFVWIGAASTSYAQTLMYHKDAFTFATADLPIYGSAELCVVKSYDGLSIRCWQDADIRNDELLTRIDILYGYKAIRPQWACRITS